MDHHRLLLPWVDHLCQTWVPLLPFLVVVVARLLEKVHPFLEVALLLVKVLPLLEDRLHCQACS